MNKLTTVAIKSLNATNDLAGVIENAVKAAPFHALFGAWLASFAFVLGCAAN